MSAGRLTGSGLFAVIAAFVVAGLGGKTFAGEAVSRSEASPRSKPALRVAFNASGLRPSADSRLLADPPELAAIKEVAALHKAAEAGDTRAQVSLGYCYQGGQGMPKDITQAIAWFRRAAVQGFDEAEYALGCCYNGDDGLPKDSAEAAKWWGKAAAHGFAEAQYCLGLSYATGDGVSPSSGEAAKWWQKAAAQNHAGAQYFLGLSYAAGLGVPKAPEQALYWLRKAANNGNEDAIVALKKLGKEAGIPAKKQSADREHQDSSNRPG